MITLPFLVELNNFGGSFQMGFVFLFGMVEG